MDQETSELIMRVIARAPQWLRHDLSSKDLTPVDGPKKHSPP